MQVNYYHARAEHATMKILTFIHYHYKMTKNGYKYGFQNPFLVDIQLVVSNIISYNGKSEIYEAKVLEC